MLAVCLFFTFLGGVRWIVNNFICVYQVYGVYLYQQKQTTMTTQQIQLNDKVRNLNLQINQQLKRAGVLNAKMNVVKPLSELPNSEWKNWIAELIEYRNNLESQLA